MIISAADLKQYIETEESDPVLEVKLQALESLIRKYTNNNFQLRSIRSQSAGLDNQILTPPQYLKIGDTIHDQPECPFSGRLSVPEARLLYTQFPDYPAVT